MSDEVQSDTDGLQNHREETNVTVDNQDLATVRVAWNGEVGEITPIATPRVPSGAFTSNLHVAGAYLSFDVRNSRAPAATIYDLPSALWWVDSVYGEAVAHSLGELLEESHRGTAADSVVVEVSLGPTSEIMGVLQRLALGFWLTRYWPATEDVRPIDESLLGIELGALAWAADGCFLGHQPASVLLTPHLHRLLELGEKDGQLAAPRSAIVRSALEAASQTVSGDNELLPEIDDLLDRLAITGQDADPDGDEVDEAIVSLIGQPAISVDSRQSEHSLVASFAEPPEEQTLASGTDSVDWQQVPPRVLAWDENTVEWNLHPTESNDKAKLVVRVLAAVDGGRSPDLFARIYNTQTSSDMSIPRAVVRLHAGTDDEWYIGETDLERSSIDPAIIVDVFSNEFATRPLVGKERSDARTWRGHAREFIEQRASWVDGRISDQSDPARPFWAEQVTRTAS
jgi:hypothetical protein